MVVPCRRRAALMAVPPRFCSSAPPHDHRVSHCSRSWCAPRRARARSHSRRRRAALIFRFFSWSCSCLVPFATVPAACLGGRAAAHFCRPAHIPPYVHWCGYIPQHRHLHFIGHTPAKRAPPPPRRAPRIRIAPPAPRRAAHAASAPRRPAARTHTVSVP